MGYKTATDCIVSVWGLLTQSLKAMCQGFDHERPGRTVLASFNPGERPWLGRGVDRPAEGPGQGTGFQGVRRDGLEPAGKAAREPEGRAAGEVGVSGGGRPVPGDPEPARAWRSLLLFRAGTQGAGRGADGGGVSVVVYASNENQSLDKDHSVP